MGVMLECSHTFCTVKSDSEEYVALCRTDMSLTVTFFIMKVWILARGWRHSNHDDVQYGEFVEVRQHEDKRAHSHIQHGKKKNEIFSKNPFLDRETSDGV